MKEKVMYFLKRNIRHLLVGGVLLFTCFLTYTNSLHNGFLIDDYELILNNTQIRHITLLPLSFTPLVASGEERRYYRPITHLLTMLIYLIVGANPLGYHLANLISFFICAIALYGLINFLFQNWKIAFLTSLFFCVHPINGMLINYKTATGLSFVIFSMIFSLIFNLLFEQKGKKIYLVVSFIWFFIALLCHETALIFPLYVAAMLFLVKKYSVRQTIQKILPYCVVSLSYFLLRLQFVSLKNTIIDNIPSFHMSFASYLASFFKLMLGYLLRLISMQDITLNWVIPIVRENLFWWDVGFILTLWGCFYLIFFRWKSGIKSFALSWFLIGFLPATMACLLQPVCGLQIEPHWLYFSTIGFFLFLANAFVYGEKISKTLRKVLMILLLAISILNSHYYNYLWGEEKRYCQYWLRVAPQNLMTKFFLANAYLYDKKYEKAKELYGELLSKHWYYPKIYNNLGLIECAQGNPGGAIQKFKMSLQIKPDSATTYAYLGEAFLDLEDYLSAEQAWLKAIDLNPLLLGPQYNLAFLHWMHGDYEKAANFLEKCLEIDPRDEPSMLLLAEVDLRTGNKLRAIELARNLLRNTKDPERLVYLGNAFAVRNFSNMAFALYNRALQIAPHNKNAYLEMGKLYGNHEQFNRAIAVWQEGQRYSPEEEKFNEFIRQARELMSQRVNK